MEARAKLLGHPVHQMLIVLPLGLLAGAVVFDVIHLLTGEPGWALVSYWLIPAGVLSGLLAAVFGVIDWTKIPVRTRAWRIGLLHAVANVGVLLLFAASWRLRGDAEALPDAAALALSFAGGALALFSGWLGGELVDRLGVGVDDGAHLNAPSSLSGRPATEHVGERARAGVGD